MIDWVSCQLPLIHPPQSGGFIQSGNEHGEVEWHAVKGKSLEGSFEARILIKSEGAAGEGMASHIYFDGNPSKFLQGHNLFGSSDLLSLMAEAYGCICKIIGVTPSAQELEAVRNGHYSVFRLDYTKSFDLPCRSDVRSFLRALEFKASHRGGRLQNKNGSIYCGSRELWQFLFYGKGDEIEKRKHRLPENIPCNYQLNQWADKKLRAEMRLYSKYLKRHDIQDAASLTPERLEREYETHLRSINMTDQLSLSGEDLMKLPQRLQLAYKSWLHGENLSQLMTKATFYRYRKQLLKYGINISIQRERADFSNVVPMIRILEAVPASIPDFAFEHGLVHHSAKRVA